MPPKKKKTQTGYDFKNCTTRKKKNGPYVKKDVIAAINETGGVFKEMAALLGRRRSSIYDYVLRNPDVREYLEDMREEALDDVEQMAFVMAKSGDGPTVRFLLSTIGKERGYTTREEISGPNGGPLEVSTLDVKNLSDEAIEEILKARKNAD